MTFFLAAGMIASAQTTNPTPVPSVQLQIEISATPAIAAVYQVGETASVQFRARIGNLTTNNLFALPVVVGTSDLDGHDLTAQTTKCDLKQGLCSVKSDKAQVLLITVWQNGVFGLQQVALNFVNLRLDFPASIDVTASMAQGEEGVTSSLIATSPVSISGPVTVRADAVYVNSSDALSRDIYFPDGVRYGQRIEINTDTLYPLSFRGRRNFRVQFYNQSGNLVAEGYGASVGLSEWKGVSAVMDENKDLVFTLDAPYSASVDYTAVLLRGNQFRVELAQSRGELYAYPQGNQTKLIFNRGSLGENTYYLPHGFYTVSIRQFDRSNGIRINQSRADALGLNGQYILK